VKATLELINQMQADGVIGQYAIGGAVGAMLYLEPAATLDVDIFVNLPVAPGTSPLTLTPIYDYLKVRGSSMQHEHIVIAGWPVQFLAPRDNLEREAVAEAVPTAVDGVSTRVISAEHLVAIALHTGRSKDHIRIVQFLEQNAVSREKLDRVLERHGLTLKWKQFAAKYLEERHE